jgi:hypothetical protein
MAARVWLFCLVSLRRIGYSRKHISDETPEFDLVIFHDGCIYL